MRLTFFTEAPRLAFARARGAREGGRLGRGGLQPLALLGVLLVAPVARACPDCLTSERVRAAVLGEGFWSHLLMLLVPFLLIGAFSALLHRVGLPWRVPAPPDVPEERQPPGAKPSHTRGGR